jgi:hypothetical protein
MTVPNDFACQRLLHACLDSIDLNPELVIDFLESCLIRPSPGTSVLISTSETAQSIEVPSSVTIFADIASLARKSLEVAEGYELVCFVNDIAISPTSSVSKICYWLWNPTFPESPMVVRCSAIPSDDIPNLFSILPTDSNFDWTSILADLNNFAKLVDLLNPSNASLLPKLINVLFTIARVKSKAECLISLNAYSAIIPILKAFATAILPTIAVYRSALTLAIRFFPQETGDSLAESHIESICGSLASVYFPASDQKLWLDLFALLFLMIDSKSSRFEQMLALLVGQVVRADSLVEFNIFETNPPWLPALAVLLLKFDGCADIRPILISSHLFAHSLTELRSLFPAGKYLSSRRRATVVPECLIRVLTVAFRGDPDAQTVLLESDAELLRILVFLKVRAPDPTVELLFDALQEKPSACADRIPGIADEIQAKLQGFVCTVCGNSEGDLLGFPLIGNSIGLERVHKGCCSEAVAILPCAGGSVEGFATAITPEGGNTFFEILKFTRRLFLEFEKLSVVPFLVSAGFSVLTDANAPVRDRVPSDCEAEALAVLPLWILDNRVREALYIDIREKFVKDDTTGKLAKLLFVVARVQAVVRSAIGDEAAIDAAAFVEAVARDGREIADAVRSEMGAIAERLEADPAGLLDFIPRAIVAEAPE